MGENMQTTERLRKIAAAVPDPKVAAELEKAAALVEVANIIAAAIRDFAKMATAEIAPVVSAEMLTSGTTLANTEKKEDPFVIPLGEQAQPVKGTSEITVEFTQSPPSVTVNIIDRVPSAHMDSVMFGALTHPRLRLRKPIPLEVSEEEGQVVLNWEAASEFSSGATMGDALDDFSKAVTELYLELNDPNVRLGADLEGVRRILADYIEPRR